MYIDQWNDESDTFTTGKTAPFRLLWSWHSTSTPVLLLSTIHPFQDDLFLCWLLAASCIGCGKFANILSFVCPQHFTCHFLIVDCSFLIIPTLLRMSPPLSCSANVVFKNKSLLDLVFICDKILQLLHPYKRLGPTERSRNLFFVSNVIFRLLHQFQALLTVLSTI